MASQAQDGLSMWAVETKADGELAGICGLRRTRAYSGTPVDEELEIGWRIGERFWGQGIAREAAQASIDWGFANRPEPRISAWVHPGQCAVVGPDAPARHGAAHEELDFHHPLYAADDPGRRPASSTRSIGPRLDRDRTPDPARAGGESDIDPFHAMGQDPEVMRFIGPAPTVAPVGELVDRQNAILAEHGHCFWALEAKADGAFMGFCGVKPGVPDTPIAGQPEIGWRLASAHWGKGYAREAAEAALAWMWINTAAPLVAAITVPANTRSWGLMERLGMTRYPDDDFDHPALAEGDPLRRHIVYRIHRPLGV